MSSASQSDWSLVTFPMIVHRHPHAIRKMLTWIGVFLTATICIWGIGMWAQATGHQRVFDVAGGALFCLVVAFIVFCLSAARRCVCPGCGKVLRWRGRLSEEGTFLFECSDCTKAWDAGYSTSGGFRLRS